MNVVGDNGGPRLTIQDLALEIARGRVVGAEPFGAFGEFEATGGEVNQIIWPNGPFVYPPATGVAITIVSDNSNDTLAGTGVQQVEMHYLDMTLTPQNVVINMNGLTGVTTDKDGNPLTGVRFIQCLHVETTGTFGQGAVGTITAKTGATIYALIAAGDVRCASSARMVPKGKRAFVYGLVGSSISGTAAARAKLQIVATELDNHQYTDQGIFIPFGSIGSQDNSEAFVLPVPLVFIENTVIAMNSTVDKAATITGDWFGWVEDVT